MKDVSNKTIIILISLAMVVTLVGTAISVVRLNSLGGGYVVFTGAATQNTSVGETTITISQVASLTNVVNSIAFGSGSVASTCSECQMDSNGHQNQSGACCMQFNNVSQGFLLENTGNVDISINYTCAGSCTAATFLGGTSPSFGIRSIAWFLDDNATEATQAGTNDTDYSCRNASISGWNWSSSGAGGYKEVTAAGDWLCGNATSFALNFTDTYDAGLVHLNVSIPVDAPTGSEKTATFTFNAYTSS